MVETAGDALAILSDDSKHDEDTSKAVHDRVREFEALAARYFSLVNVVLYVSVSRVMETDDRSCMTGYPTCSKRQCTIPPQDW